MYRIRLYFINYNDSWYFPFIKKHYSYCDSIICLDNYSTDNSKEIAESLGFEFRTFGIKGELSDMEYLKVKNHVWKECRDYDYVIVVDADEFLVIDSMPMGSAPYVAGFDMASEKLPEKDIMEINTGYFMSNYSKQAIFNPNMITEINYGAGCHWNRMHGNIERYGYCKLFHYRCIGGVQRLIDRHKVYRERLQLEKAKQIGGIHYFVSDEDKKNEWTERLSKCKELWKC